MLSVLPLTLVLPVKPLAPESTRRPRPETFRPPVLLLSITPASVRFCPLRSSRIAWAELFLMRPAQSCEALAAL